MPGLFPVSGAPVSGLLSSGGELFNCDLSDSMVASVTLFDYRKVALDASDAGSLVDALTNNLLFNLRESLSGVDAVTNQAKLACNLTSAASFTDVIRAAWHMLLQDEAEALDSAEYRIRKALALADALVASAVVDGKLTAYAACAVAATLEDSARAGWSLNLADQGTLTDAVQNTLTAMLSLAETATIADSAIGTLRLSLLCDENATVDDSLAANLRLNADLESGAILYCSFRIGGEEYSGWAMNTDLWAVTQHSNQRFDSILSFKGFHYAAGPGGIVQITGDTDDGEDIDAHIRTFLTDFGTHKFKRAPDIFVGLATDGRMLVKARTRDPNTGVLTEDWYELVTKQGAGEAQGRAKVGRGLKSTWWGMTLQNIDGADFRLDEIAWRMIVLDRRQ